MSLRKLFTLSRNEKGKEKEDDAGNSCDIAQTSEQFSVPPLSRGSQITHQEEKRRDKLGGSAISYGEKERVSSSGSPRSVKERFGNFLSAGHSPIGSVSTSPREKTLKGGVSKSADNSPREKPKRLGSLINFNSSRRKLWQSFSNRSPSLDALPTSISEEIVKVESREAVDEISCEEMTASSSTTDKSERQGNANPCLVEYMLETSNVTKDENQADEKKLEEASQAENTSGGEMYSQTNTECDSLSISDSSISLTHQSDVASCKHDSVGKFTKDKSTGLKTIVPKDSKVRYEIPASFTEEQAANLARQTNLQFKLGDENLLAKGTFGEVGFAIIYNHPAYENGAFIAVKKVNKSALQRIAGEGNNAKKMMRTEIKITAKLLAKGFAIVPTIDMVRFKSSIYQMMPIYNLTGDDVVNYIKYQRSLPEDKREVTEEELVFLGVKTGIALATTVVALHKLNTFHFDIKPSNFFINCSVRNEEFQIDFALADFGSAHLLHKNKKPKVQITSATDPIYIAPEVNSVPRKDIDDRLVSPKPKYKHQRITLIERWRIGLLLSQLLEPQFSEEEFLKSGHIYYNETKMKRTFHYSTKIPGYNEQLKKLKDILCANKYLTTDLIDALQGLLNPDYSEREKTSLNTMVVTLKSYNETNEKLDKGKEKVGSSNRSEFSDDDKKILGPLYAKVLAYKNNVLEQKRVEKVRAEQEKLEQERIKQERIEQERIEHERKRAALSSIHKMGKFSVNKKLAIDQLDDIAPQFLGLSNGGSTSS